MRVKNWGKFQHFKNRRPPWIKLYRDLLDDHEYAALSPQPAKYLILLWLLASEDQTKQGLLPSIQEISFRLRLSEKTVISIISDLSHWIDHDDITMISPRHQLGSSETETETEIDMPLRANGDDVHLLKTKRKTAFPETWTVEPWMEELCGRSGLNAASEFTQFKNHHLSKGSMFVSWPHAFRTWADNAVKFRRESPKPSTISYRPTKVVL